MARNRVNKNFDSKSTDNLPYKVLLPWIEKPIEKFFVRLFVPRLSAKSFSALTLTVISTIMSSRRPPTVFCRSFRAIFSVNFYSGESKLGAVSLFRCVQNAISMHDFWTWSDTSVSTFCLFLFSGSKLLLCKNLFWQLKDNKKTAFSGSKNQFSLATWA